MLKTLRTLLLPGCAHPTQCLKELLTPGVAGRWPSSGDGPQHCGLGEALWLLRTFFWLLRTFESVELIAAVQLTLFTMVVSAPASSKILTTFLWFRAAATWRAVSPACKQPEDSLCIRLIGSRIAMHLCLGCSLNPSKTCHKNMKLSVQVWKRPQRRMVNAFTTYSFLPEEARSHKPGLHL